MLMELARNYLVVWWLRGKKRPWSHSLTIVVVCFLINVAVFLATGLLLDSGLLSQEEIENLTGGIDEYVLNQIVRIPFTSFVFVPFFIWLESLRLARKQKTKKADPSDDT